MNEPVSQRENNLINSKTDLNYNTYNKELDDALYDDDVATKINYKKIKTLPNALHIPAIATITRTTNERFIEVCYVNFFYKM